MIEKKFGLKKKCKRECSDTKDYVFAFEDQTIRATAKAALSFVPIANTTSKEDVLTFDYRPAFDYTEEIETNSDTISCGKYRTIFTYSELPISDPKLDSIDDPLREHSRWTEIGATVVLYGLSGLLLLALFPILCWMFVKYVARDERLIVFRLGKRLKLKGPGLVLLLPFCDRFFSIRLNEQTLDVGPVFGGTKDEALVELRCSVTYRLTDPDFVCTTVQETPEKLLRKEAQLCLLSSLARFPWTYLDGGNAVQDLSSNTITSLNLRCSSYGIYVTNLAIQNIRLERSPPSPDHLQKRRMSVLQKHLRAISSTLIPNLSPEVWSVTETQSTNNEPIKHPIEVGHGSVDHSIVSIQPRLSDAQSLPASIVKHSTLPTTAFHDVCVRALDRVKPLLKNTVVCKALGHKRMQIIVSSNRPSFPLPRLVEANESGEFGMFYIDALNGQSDLGALPSTESPDVTLYLCAADLKNVLAGRLNLLDAIREQTVFLTGDQVAFDRLRHLLHF